MFSQNEEIITFKGNIPNPNDSDYSSFTVLDIRNDIKLGSLFYGKEGKIKNFKFENSLKTDLENWYIKSNYKGKEGELIMVVDKFKIGSIEKLSNPNLGLIQFSVQSFLKKDDSYRFLYKKDTVFIFDKNNSSNAIKKGINHIFSKYFEKTYQSKAVGDPLNEENIKNYKDYIKSKYSLFSTNKLKDGLYLDYQSFLKQQPNEVNFKIVINEHAGQFINANVEKNGRKRDIPSEKIYAYVENGIAYKTIYFDKRELKKDELGFYIIAKPSEISNQKTHGGLGYSSYLGLTGFLIDIAVNDSSKTKSDKESKIYLDPLIGNFDIYDSSVEGLSNLKIIDP